MTLFATGPHTKVRQGYLFKAYQQLLSRTRFHNLLLWIAFLSVGIHDILPSPYWRCSAHAAGERRKPIRSENPCCDILIFLEKGCQSLLLSFLLQLYQLFCSCISYLEHFSFGICFASHRQQTYNVCLFNHAESGIAAPYVSFVVRVFCKIAGWYSNWVIIGFGWIGARRRVAILRVQWNPGRSFRVNSKRSPNAIPYTMRLNSVFLLHSALPQRIFVLEPTFQAAVAVLAD